MPDRRYPSPFKPLPSIQRDTLPGQERRPLPRPREQRPAAPLPPAVDAIAEGQRVGNANPILTITADITLPQKEGYGRRLNALIRMLAASIEEEAPWLSNVQVTVSASSLPKR